MPKFRAIVYSSAYNILHSVEVEAEEEFEVLDKAKEIFIDRFGPDPEMFAVIRGKK